MDKISREKYTEIVKTIDNRFGSFIGVINGVLEAAGIEVEPPPILPGVTPGKWMSCCGHDADIGRYYIIANNVRIAEVYVPADRTVMSASKELTEAAVKCCKEIEKLDIPGEMLSKIRNTLALPLEKAIGKAW